MNHLFNTLTHIDMWKKRKQVKKKKLANIHQEVKIFRE